jgi:hypothetical protein
LDKNNVRRYLLAARWQQNLPFGVSGSGIRFPDGTSILVEGTWLMVEMAILKGLRAALIGGLGMVFLSLEVSPVSSMEAANSGSNGALGHQQPFATTGTMEARETLRRNVRIYLAQNNQDDLLLQGAPPAGAAGGKDDLLLQGAPAAPTSGQDDLLLQGAPPAAPASEPAETAAPAAEPAKDADKEHAKLFVENKYPSANTCATCHPKHYEQWSVSQHAYAQLSPIFMAFQATINSKTSTTNGDFCVRCHNQVGMNLKESIFISNLDRHPTSREGITCVVCHRVNRNYGKVSGRLALVEGDLFSAVYGPAGEKELERVLSLPQKYRVVTERNKPGRAIHTKAEKFFEISKPSFCGTCHDVTLLNGFRLEEAFAEYKQSPASKNGVTCQDCHMGKVQGVAAGYDQGPAAIVGGVPTKTRKVTDHFFAGPDYPIIHPGLFPHNVEAAAFKSLREWLQFDHKAGWGTDAFENNLPEGYKFPEAWQSIDDRYDAREIIKVQYKRLKVASRKRMEVLRNAFKLSDIRVTRNDTGGLEFDIDVMNMTDGHGVPTGFDAERLMFLQIDVTDADGKVIFRSGDRDPNGDVRDLHSLYVHNGELPLDEQLFNLQSKFLVRTVRGGEREQILAVNTSGAVLPFVRPERRATTIFGRPRGARKHKKTIGPLGKRTASYSVEANALTGRAPYRINAKFISQMVPVNLLSAIQGVGFDYGMSPKEIGDAVVAGAQVIRETSLTVGASTARRPEN